jgi:hypothetical protein
MRRRRRATIEDLRLAIDGMPRHTKIAMLEGIRTNEIIVGAYTSNGGICPMLAAHRAGGRTSFIAFANAWDRFALRESRSTAARRATERELLILTAQLEASLVAEQDGATDLAAAVGHHRELVARRRARAEKSTSERSTPRDAPGRSWTRVVRRFDDYERMLEQLEMARYSLDASAGPGRRKGERVSATNR